MKAIILATGKATRLLPLTKDTPQSLLKINGKTILEIQVENLKKAGVSDIIVITGHLSEKFEKYSALLNLKLLFNPFYDFSGMVPSLWVAKEELKDGFLFLYSDVLFDSDVFKGLLENKNDICLAVKRGELREEAEKVVERDGAVVSISKCKIREQTSEFIGAAKVSDFGARKLIKELDVVTKADLNASFIFLINSLIRKSERIGTFDIKDSYFIDIDFPEDLENAKKIF